VTGRFTGTVSSSGASMRVSTFRFASSGSRPSTGSRCDGRTRAVLMQRLPGKRQLAMLAPAVLA